MRKIVFLILILMSATAFAQNLMTPELLWKLGRVTSLGISKDSKNIIYKVTVPSVAENKSDSKYYAIPINGGNAVEITDYKAVLKDKNVSPDGKYLVYNEEVKIDNIHGRDFYPELEKSDVQIYNGLDYRHWDTWNEGRFNHVLYRENKEGQAGTDIMKGEAFDSPQKPFGGDEDYIWSPDGKVSCMSLRKFRVPAMPSLPIPIFMNIILKRKKPLTVPAATKVMIRRRSFPLPETYPGCK